MRRLAVNDIADGLFIYAIHQAYAKDEQAQAHGYGGQGNKGPALKPENISKCKFKQGPHVYLLFFSHGNHREHREKMKKRCVLCANFYHKKEKKSTATLSVQQFSFWPK